MFLKKESEVWMPFRVKRKEVCQIGLRDPEASVLFVSEAGVSPPCKDVSASGWKIKLIYIMLNPKKKRSGTTSTRIGKRKEVEIRSRREVVL